MREKLSLYKNYLTLFLRSRYFWIPVSLYIILSIPQVVFRIVNYPEATYVKNESVVEVDVDIDSTLFDSYIEDGEPNITSDVVIIASYLDAVKAVESGVKGVYKLDTEDNSNTIKVLASNLLKVENDSFKYKNKRVKFYYSKIGLVMEVE